MPVVEEVGERCRGRVVPEEEHDLSIAEIREQLKRLVWANPWGLTPQQVLDLLGAADSDAKNLSAAKLLQPNGLLIVLVGDQKRFLPALTKAGFQAEPAPPELVE